ATTMILPFTSIPSYGLIFFLSMTYPFPAKTSPAVTSTGCNGGAPRPPGTVQSLPYSRVTGPAGPAARPPPPPRPPRPAGRVNDAFDSSGTTDLLTSS